MTHDLQIFILADDPLVRSGLALLLRGQEGLTVLGQGAAPGEMQALLAPRSTGGSAAALWDLGAGPQAAGERLAKALDEADEEGLEAVVWLAPDASLEEGSAVLARLIQPPAAGRVVRGRGVVRREAGAGQIVQALQAAAAGLVVLEPGVLREGQERLPGLREPANPGEPSHGPGRGEADSLTRREIEVLELAAQGLANKAIAVRLGISEHTVKFHINTILGKLGAASRTEAVTRAARLGIIVI